MKEILLSPGGMCLTAVTVHLMSFGFKYGEPEADLVFDVRSLPNPFYVPELREHTGLETCVQDYVLDFPESRECLQKIQSKIESALSASAKEKKEQVTIAIGCTGGHHRSVTMVESLVKILEESGYPVLVSHRDIQKGI